jgi:hypothetical protein
MEDYGLGAGGVTRVIANLAAPERVRQFACANEGADKLSSGAGRPACSAAQDVA